MSRGNTCPLCRKVLDEQHHPRHPLAAVEQMPEPVQEPEFVADSRIHALAAAAKKWESEMPPTQEDYITYDGRIQTTVMKEYLEKKQVWVFERDIPRPHSLATLLANLRALHIPIAYGRTPLGERLYVDWPALRIPRNEPAI